MSKKEKDIAMHLSFCIEQYAKTKDMAAEEVVDIFSQDGMADHSCRFFDVIRMHYKDLNAKITQDNLYLLLPMKIGWLAPWLSEDMNISIAEAMNRTYHSTLYKKLSTESTKYWHLGPVDLYNELKAEL